MAPRHHAIGLLRFDLAVDRDCQFVERPVGGEGMSEVAERILVLMQDAVLRQIDAPVHHVLAVMVARGKPQRLRHRRGRRVVAIGGVVGNTNPHGVRMTGPIRTGF